MDNSQGKEGSMRKCIYCGGTKMIVYFMNEFSRANDYYCRICRKIFRYSYSNNKQFKLTKERIDIIKRISERKREWIRKEVKDG